MFCVVAIAVAAVSLAGTAGQGREVKPAPAEYTVASAAGTTAAVAAGAPRASAPRLPGTTRGQGRGPLPETLMLVVVGGLLIGLAAAVRRTT